MTISRSQVMRGADLVVATGAVAASLHQWAAARRILVGSPGVPLGNVVRAPVSIPVNACGNTVDVMGLLKRAIDNLCPNTRRHFSMCGGRHRHSEGVWSPAQAPSNRTTHFPGRSGCSDFRRCSAR
ncbi:chaplin [Streptomyces sp. MMBL 11-3]|uniref:chaplin n=1 Tax=Streptomyces sp. MMBL 11-3 TaxID=3382639 RepID=UPI0039B4CE80